MTVLQTIGVYVLIPLALYGVLALFTLWSRIARAPRYRPGQPWTFEPVWWTGSPEGIGVRAAAPGTSSTSGLTASAKGGARGNW